MEYGNKLSPKHSLRMAHRIKETRQKIIITHNPSEVDQNQLLVKFSNLDNNDIKVPGMANLLLVKFSNIDNNDIKITTFE